LRLYHFLLISYDILTNNMVAILKKAAILIYFLTYNICIVSIDFVDLEYIGIDTKIVYLSFFVQ
jgi:hypothetical protein